MPDFDGYFEDRLEKFELIQIEHAKCHPFIQTTKIPLLGGYVTVFQRKAECRKKD